MVIETNNVRLKVISQNTESGHNYSEVAGIYTAGFEFETSQHTEGNEISVKETITKRLIELTFVFGSKAEKEENKQFIDSKIVVKIVMWLPLIRETIYNKKDIITFIFIRKSL